MAEQFSGALPGISLIELGSSWIAVAAGPLPEAQAAALLRDLRATGAIPRDSYLSDGARFGEVLWRAGTEPLRLGPRYAKIVWALPGLLRQHRKDRRARRNRQSA